MLNEYIFQAKKMKVSNFNVDYDVKKMSDREFWDLKKMIKKYLSKYLCNLIEKLPFIIFFFMNFRKYEKIA